MLLLHVCQSFAATPTTTPQPPPIALMHSGFFPIRVNPLGTSLTGSLMTRFNLQPSNPGILRKDTWFEVGLESTVSPTFATVGPAVRFKPLAILEMKAMWETTQFFGVLGSVLPYDAVDVDYSPAGNRERSRNGENQSAFGSRLTLMNTLQAQVGPIAMRNITSAVYWSVNAPGVGFYDAGRDLLQPNGGWNLIHDVDLFLVQDKFIVGGRYTYADALYGTGGTGDQPTHRAGPVFIKKLVDRPAQARKTRSLTFFALVQWHLAHPWRAGTVSPRGYPLMAAAIAWEGEVLRTRR